MTKIEKKSHIFEREKHDHYVEPIDLGASIFAALALPAGSRVVDPCCGWGRMVRAARASDLQVLGSDIVPRWNDGPDGPLPDGAPFVEADWFSPEWADSIPEHFARPAAIVSNPPFDRLEEWLPLALDRASWIVAAVVPRNFIWGDKRSAALEETPFWKFMPMVPRPSMPPGSAILAGQKATGDTKDYGLAVWLKSYRGAPQIEWLRRAKP